MLSKFQILFKFYWRSKFSYFLRNFVITIFFEFFVLEKWKSENFLGLFYVIYREDSYFCSIEEIKIKKFLYNLYHKLLYNLYQRCFTNPFRKRGNSCWKIQIKQVKVYFQIFFTDQKRWFEQVFPLAVMLGRKIFPRQILYRRNGWRHRFDWCPKCSFCLHWLISYCSRHWPLKFSEKIS